jgi:serine/threonine protein kinase
MNRVVALKVLAPHYSNTERGRRLFVREMQAVARLSHPNIVTAYDAGEIGRRAYLVMEYVDGPSLEHLVRQQGPLPVGQACEFIRQAALGLQFAFEKGMVHRDIKPGNLLLARDHRGSCTVRLLDFGLARLYEPQPLELTESDSVLSRENVVMGTPDYVSPEQARNLHSADIRSDLYSLGCTFYYLLTGQVVFRGGTVMEKLIRHTTEEAASVTKLRPEIPTAVADIVARLLKKNSDDRFQTPAQLAAALQAFAVDMPLPIPTITPADPAAALTGDSDVDQPALEEGPLSDVAAGTIPPGSFPTYHSARLPTRPRAPTTASDEFRQRVVLALAIATGVIASLVGMLVFLWGR